MRDFLNLDRLDDGQLLRLALLLQVYGSPDMAHFLLQHFDSRNNTGIAADYMKLLLDAKLALKAAPGPSGT
jgi:hypothetical protein